MRYSVSCRYLREKEKGAYVYQESFKSMGDSLTWLHHRYRECNDTMEPYFEWVIFDFQTKELFTDSIKTIKDSSFLDLIFEFKEMSRFLKVKNQ